MSAPAQDVVAESTCAISNPLDPFHQLVQDLSLALGPSSGLDSEDVDLLNLQGLMETYRSDPKEWTKYAFGDQSRAYTRNLVDIGNGKSNLVSYEYWNHGTRIGHQR